MKYICECSKEFDSAQKFNGHKSHCKIHLAAVGKLDAYEDRQARASATGRKAKKTYCETKKLQYLNAWLSEKHTCEKCGKVMTEKFGSGRFCSRACANSHQLSEDTKSKISKTLVNHLPTSGQRSYQSKRLLIAKENYSKNIKYCSICGKILPFDRRFYKTCGGEDCLKTAYSNAGKISATTVTKRSKNEIAFCDLCEKYFGLDKVIHNVPMFNGWDADIILVDFKLAILWNGPWHYKKVTKSHSLAQVQTRDLIKLNEIQKCGFTPYIIEDMSKASSDKVLKEFNLLLDYIKNKAD